MQPIDYATRQDFEGITEHGDVEEQIRTNWPTELCRKAKPRQDSFYAVDVDGVTVATSTLNTSAMATARYWLAQGRDVEVRFVQLEEKDFQQAEEQRKEKFWQEFLYKPTPARIVHHGRR